VVEVGRFMPCFRRNSNPKSSLLKPNRACLLIAVHCALTEESTEGAGRVVCRGQMPVPLHENH
jgi:hypothetical protein